MKKGSINLAILVLILVSFQNCTKDKITINSIVDLEDYIRDEMDAQNIPAMSIISFKESEILYENYFGKSNLEQNIPLANDHLFLLASISKVVTATALLQLNEAGKFSLDDNINDYLPFNVSVPNQNTPITFRMLLTHTSGIADGSAIIDQYYYEMDSPIALDYFLENYLVPGGEFYNETENFYDFEPGSEYKYSNEGSALIAVLVEQISNIDFNSYCKENIFQPLEMTHTFWRLDECFESNYTIVQPYNYINKQYEAVQHYTFTDYPNGGLRTTGRDLLSFMSAFIQKGISNNYQLLKSSTINSMITPHILVI